MTKRSSLFSVPATATATAPEAPIATIPELPADVGRRGPVPKSRAGKRAITAYLDDEAHQQLQMLMVTERTTMQALLLEGVNAVFAKRGRSRLG